MKRTARVIIIVVFLAVLGLGALFLANLLRNFRNPHSSQLWQWADGDETIRSDLVTVQRDMCPEAFFILPTDGFIGLLYGDTRPPYSAVSPHQGIDIFSNSDPGQTPVYAAYDGFISREDNWRSALIQRIPDDPVNPGRQIWLYYAHMADRNGNSFIAAAFPPGTHEIFVKQGTLLGYTGDYNGGALRTVWVHLHFSIVEDDGYGGYANELEYANTIDPTPYLGLPVNFTCGEVLMACGQHDSCSE